MKRTLFHEKKRLRRSRIPILPSFGARRGDGHRDLDDGGLGRGLGRILDGGETQISQTEGEALRSLRLEKGAAKKSTDRDENRARQPTPPCGRGHHFTRIEQLRLTHQFEPNTPYNEASIRNQAVEKSGYREYDHHRNGDHHESFHPHVINNRPLALIAVAAAPVFAETARRRDHHRQRHLLFHESALHRHLHRSRRVRMRPAPMFSPISTTRRASARPTAATPRSAAVGPRSNARAPRPCAPRRVPPKPLRLSPKHRGPDPVVERWYYPDRC